ncbi:CCA tRNA nucleotidyltransferase [Roseibium polysiphoniae]|uniref:CCA tRNA nucleotidyltransferase n=1 Tax=Roseibium polysiphoniae TaxID=2571221 RepID=A0ABR9C820_9HYPH|nr:CCA tRNA nucleotidyltransferase [Roseibium polysiphoniae]MBD8876054.1 CCA tRNA nucleotidyltransferase [Roseibium polysiphoniae]
MTDRRITAEWLQNNAIQAVFDAIERHDDAARVVGGAVRNSLLDKPVADIDIATTAAPSVVAERTERAGLKVIPTGIDHGTVTVISSGVAYEITTLREDIETFGRQAKVRFGRDWTEDARRRDFTMNALYCDRSGAIHDPLGGLTDCLERRVRFIGSARDRIQEDYLRILRFFRIHAAYGNGEPDPEGLTACVHEREGLRSLSAERIGMEMKRLVVAALAPQCLSLMENHGLLEIVTGGVSRIADFTAFRGLAPDVPEVDEPALALAALVGFVDEDMDRLSDRLRLSNSERKRMHGALAAGSELIAKPVDPAAVDTRKLLYRHGRQTSVDGVVLAYSRQSETPLKRDLLELLARLRRTEIPQFPLKGRDLLANGIAPGPDVGRVLERLESCWIESGFALTAKELIGRI